VTASQGLLTHHVHFAVCRDGEPSGNTDASPALNAEISSALNKLIDYFKRSSNCIAESREGTPRDVSPVSIGLNRTQISNNYPRLAHSNSAEIKKESRKNVLLASSF